ncbi:cathelicidin-B1-like [Phaenicophaeus curvirostris]|uniref:cathelicidin-B1-like n=1 Tax=Phaenicophaeus curvirostris TaxID=33595 RepID=UPI0037F0FC52
MRLCRALLLLLLLVGLARATTVTPDGGSTREEMGSISPSTSPRWDVSYEDAISAVLELLNSRGVSPYVLRLREVQAQPGWLRDLRRRQELSFTMEETSCRAPGVATAACRTRWLGGVSRCRGFVFLEEQQPVVELTCEKVPLTLGRFPTSRLKDFLGGIKERLRSFFQCGNIWIRDKLNLQTSKP